MAKTPKSKTSESLPYGIWVGDCEQELEWVYLKLQRTMPWLKLPTEDSVRVFGRDLQPRWVILGSRSRDARLVDRYEVARHTWPDASIHVLLGAWWHGHRRTQPLPEEWTMSYWYECNEVLLHQLQAGDGLPLEPPTKSNAKLSTKLARIIESALPPSASEANKLVMVTSDDNSRLDTWCQLFSHLGWIAIGRNSQSDYPVGTFPLVVIDVGSMHGSWDNCDRILHAVAWHRSRYPKATLMATTCFPTFGLWQELEKVGVDLLFREHFSLAGFSRQLVNA